MLVATWARLCGAACRDHHRSGSHAAAISQPSSDCRSLLIVSLISFPQHSVGRYQIGGDDLHSTLSTRAAARDQDSA